LHPQCAFEHVEDIAFGDGPSRRKREGTLRARIDNVTDAENIAEDNLGDRRDRCVFEAEIVTVAACRRLMMFRHVLLRAIVGR
jgi:hypothetical protein